MKLKGKRCIANYVKMSVALLGVVGTTLLSNMSAVYAEEIIHTHIWATKYDKDKHWEYCTVCNKKQESKEHKFVDHWELGKESCHKSNGNNFNTRICACGYSYVVRKEHTKNDTWYNTGVRMVHYRKCSVCNDWTESGKCSNSSGELSCKNPGTCKTCGYKATKDYHYITKDGICKGCGKKFFDVSAYTVDYDKDYKTATIKFTFKSVEKNVEFTGTMGAYCGGPNYTKNEWKTNKKSDGSMEYTGVYTFDSSKQRKSTLNFLDRRDTVKINGVSVYVDSSIMKIDIWQDHTKPEVTEIKQVDQKIHNKWATIKELTILGKENLSKMVTISIFDKSTKDVIVDKAKASVKDGKFKYECTPPLEGPAEGRDYVLKVEDEIGNVTEKDFKIIKTDCRAPLIRSSKEFVEWSQTKDLSFELTDYGAGTPSTSLKDQVSYKKATKTADKYFSKYVFDEENYGVTEYKLYVKDGLGNAALETIKVGKIDNTNPTIEELKFSLNQMEIVDSLGQGGSKAIGAIITVVANDKNEKLKAEGSGVCGYALTKSKDKPKDEDWKTTDSLEAKEAGKYYLWVKDKAGNMADIHVLNVKEDFSVEIVEKIPVEKEKPKEEPVKEEPKDKGKDKDKDKVKDNDKDENDKTPGTGDSSFVLAAGILLLISFLMGMVVVMKRRTKY